MMKSWQMILIICVLAVGVVGGLAYGWLINPVTYINTSMDSLRIDYQTDLVLMTAEVYSNDLNLPAAIQKLSRVRENDIKNLVADSIGYAQKMNFSRTDIEILSLLKTAIDQYTKEGTEQP